jgi:hypothetical protein
MNVDRPYKGHSLRERFDNMIGRKDSAVGFAIRLSLVGFCVYTTLDHQASYYMSPLHWLVIWGLVYFYP